MPFYVASAYCLMKAATYEPRGGGDYGRPIGKAIVGLTYLSAATILGLTDGLVSSLSYNAMTKRY